MNFKPTTELTQNRRSVEDVVGKLKSDNQSESLEAGRNLMAAAKQYGLNVADYLRLAIQPSGLANELKLDGYESAKLYLGLPTKDD